MIEVEKRAFLSKEQYTEIGDRILNLGGKDLGVNNTTTVFYVTDHEQIKVQNRITKGDAKIAWKSGGIDGAEHRIEIELPFDPNDIKKAYALVEAISPHAKKYITEQQRHDFLLDDVTLSVKYSDDWGYHMEFDININNELLIMESIEIIEKVAHNLGVKLLTPDEERNYVLMKLKEKDKE